MQRVVGIVAVFVTAALLPVAAHAQASASITGTVKDASGGVLPGVTVEASSDALIEKVRTAVTDGSGQYRIVDLRVGTYTVTFTLTGFNTFKREGIELSGSFTASINAEMKVGALSETITVTGESPIVDVQSVRRQTVISNDVISSMPAARSYAGVMMLIPATITQAANLDIQVTPGMLVFGGAGGRNNEARIQVDGLNTGAAFNGAGVSSYVPDIGNAQEIAMTTSGGLGEAEVGGPSFSIVPKTGGNTFKGSVYSSNVTKGMVGSNFSDELKARGLPTPGELFKLWDYNFAVGGPIKQDKVWFFTQFRDEGSHRTVPGMFANVNMGDNSKWNYVADPSRPAVHAGSWRTASLRLTVQPNARNKFNLFWDQQQPCQGAGYPGSDEGCRQSGPNEVICGAFGSSNPACNATNAPETGTYLDGYGQRVQQATWTSPVSNKLLLEAGFGTYWSQWGGTPWPGSSSYDIISVNEQCSAGCAANGGISGLTFRSAGTYRHNFQGTTGWRASASYVTGAQSMKVGYQGGYLIDNQYTYNNSQHVTFRVNNGVPNRITETINEFPASVQRVRYDSFYAQEQWTRGRMTLQGALRYDRAWSFFPAVTIPAQRFLPTAIEYPRTEGVNAYNDLSPRGGVAIDVFGNGKTSLKINVGKYLQAAQNGLAYGVLRPSGRLSTTANRTWTDNDRDFVPDCDLTNRGAQNPATTGSVDTCAAIDNANFGLPVFTSDLDQSLRGGMGVRPGDWQYGLSVQQEILPRVSIEVGYNRRWLTAFTVVDNALQAASDFGVFSFVVPADNPTTPRVIPLPSGISGSTISGLYNANPTVSALQNNVTTQAKFYGNQTSVANGMLLNISARPRNGLVFQGGMSAGVTHANGCDIRTALPETSAVNPHCDTSIKGVRFSGLGSYTIPKVDVQVSGTFRSDQGTVLAANYVVTSAVAAQTLGRPLSNAAPNVTVNLIEPGTLYGDRITEVDMRFAKILRFGRTRTNIGFDIYNILNAAPVIGYNQGFIPNGNWLVPNLVLTPRFAKFSVQVDF